MEGLPPTEKELDLLSKISNRELELLRERAKKEAMRRCDDVVRQFVECSRPRWLSTIWACRGALQEMNECVLKKYVTYSPLSITQLTYSFQQYARRP
jgi:hypothetical protein